MGTSCARHLHGVSLLVCVLVEAVGLDGRNCYDGVVGTGMQYSLSRSVQVRSGSFRYGVG